MSLTKNKKGFTLIELLAVIVILAIIILIAASNIGAMTQTARKNVLAIEAQTLIDSAKSAYQIDLLDGTIGEVATCYPLKWLKDKGYYEKNDNDYSGSVLIKPTSTGSPEYTVWISNKSYKILGKGAGVKGKEAVLTEGNAAPDNCPNNTNQPQGTIRTGD